MAKKDKLQKTIQQAIYQARTNPQNKIGVNSGAPEGWVVSVHPPCYSYYKFGDMSLIKKVPDYDYDKRNIQCIHSNNTVKNITIWINKTMQGET